MENNFWWMLVAFILGSILMGESEVRWKAYSSLRAHCISRFLAICLAAKFLAEDVAAIIRQHLKKTLALAAAISIGLVLWHTDASWKEVGDKILTVVGVVMIVAFILFCIFWIWSLVHYREDDLPDVERHVLAHEPSKSSWLWILPLIIAIFSVFMHLEDLNAWDDLYSWLKRLRHEPQQVAVSEEVAVKPVLLEHAAPVAELETARNSMTQAIALNGDGCISMMLRLTGQLVSTKWCGQLAADHGRKTVKLSGGRLAAPLVCPGEVWTVTYRTTLPATGITAVMHSIPFGSKRCK